VHVDRNDRVDVDHPRLRRACNSIWISGIELARRRVTCFRV
jgi:hypothetical protein